MKGCVNLLTIKPRSKIYIICPPNLATGGPELLHQLAEKLSMMKYNSYIYYPSKSNNPTPERFKKYKINIANKIEEIRII